MAILDVVKEAATVLGLEVPSLVFGSNVREMIEMQATIKEAAAEIVDAYDWQKLLVVNTVTGDDVTEAHGMPEDYRRMQKTASLWSSRWSWAAEHVVSPDEWLELQTVPFVNVTGQWIVYGGQLHFLPVMASGETAKFFYVSNNIVIDSEGQPKAAFSSDTDVFRLSERLLKLGIIYKWKQAKRQPYAQELDDFEVLKGQEIDNDPGSKPVVSGRPVRNWRYGRTWPGNVSGAP